MLALDKYTNVNEHTIRNNYLIKPVENCMEDFSDGSFWKTPIRPHAEVDLVQCRK